MDKKKFNFYGAITLRRDFFVDRNGSEFDWVLSELGIPEDERADIEEISIDVDDGHYLRRGG